MTRRYRALRVLRLYILGLIVFVGIYLLVIRPWHRSWGASAAEVSNAMPADDIVTNANYASTRAITIGAPPEAVWPWLVQMGYRRGGLYSYDWLDRLQNILDRPSATTILPEFQELKPGDEIPIGGAPGWTVASVEPNKSLVFDIRQPGVRITWSWLLLPAQDGTRLVLRIRGRLDAKPKTLPVLALLDPAEFSMVRKMLTGIKQRVEGTAGTPADELKELLTWFASALLGFVGLIGALVRKTWGAPFILSWAAWCLLFYLILGQPSLYIGILLNLVLAVALLWAFLRSPAKN